MILFFTLYLTWQIFKKKCLSRFLLKYKQTFCACRKKKSYPTSIPGLPHGGGPLHYAWQKWSVAKQILLLFIILCTHDISLFNKSSLCFEMVTNGNLICVIDYLITMLIFRKKIKKVRICFCNNISLQYPVCWGNRIFLFQIIIYLRDVSVWIFTL